MSRFLNDTEISHLVSNWDKSDDENEIFNNKNEINDNFEPNIEIDIDSLPIVFDDEGEYKTIPNDKYFNNTQTQLFNNEVVSLDVCEPGTSSSNTYIDISTKSNTYDMATSSSPTVIQSVKSKTLRPKFSRKLIEITVQNSAPKKQKTEEFKKLK